MIPLTPEHENKKPHVYIMRLKNMLVKYYNSLSQIFR